MPTGPHWNSWQSASGAMRLTHGVHCSGPLENCHLSAAIIDAGMAMLHVPGVWKAFQNPIKHG